MLQWLFYAVVVTALLSLSGWLIECAFRRRKWTTRWVWLTTMIFSVLLAYFSASGFISRNAPYSWLLSHVRFLTQRETAFALPPLMPPFTNFATHATVVRWSAALPSIWFLSSALVALALAASAVQISYRRRRWPLRLLNAACVGIAPNTGPAVVGLLRPTIVIPRWVLAEEPGEQALILAHERSHLEARDPLLLTAALTALVVMPWNVALWWQVHRLRHAIEVDCDARVLRSGHDTQTYGEALINAAQRRSNFVGAVAAMAESRTLLETRIEIMTRRSHKPWTLSFVILCALAIGVAAVAAEITPPDSTGAPHGTSKPNPLGRFFTPANLASQMAEGHDPLVRTYLMGVYDLTQYSDQSCAVRGTNTPDLLEQSFTDYLKKHPDAEQEDRPAAGVAATAFSQRWSCRTKPANYLAGRYISPAALVSQIDQGNIQVAQLYLIGVYDLAQDEHRSCAARGSSSGDLLVKVYSDYLKAHPELLQSDQTAAAIAVRAIADFWSCASRKPAATQTPKSFQFLYSFSPKGWRFERQISATQWQETYETGQQSRFDILNNTETVGECHGTLTLKDDRTLQDFIPDSQCPSQDVLFRFILPGGKTSPWRRLGAMEKITYSAATALPDGNNAVARSVIPRNLEEALQRLEVTLPVQQTEAIRAGNTSPDWWAHTIGPEILKEWVNPPNSPLSAYFRSLGIDHPQDIPGLIGQFYYLYLNHRLRPPDIHVAIQLRQQYWVGLLTPKEVAAADALSDAALRDPALLQKAYVRNAEMVGDNFDGSTFSAPVPPLIMQERALREHWILRQTSMRNSRSASTYQEIVAGLDPHLGIITLNLKTDTTLISINEGGAGIGQVLIATGAPGRPPELWPMDMHVPESGPYARDLQCWRAVAGINPCYVWHIGLLPRDAQNHARFYVLARYAQVAGATGENQLSLWSWDGHSAMPIYVTSYRVEADYEVFKLAGDVFSFESKGDYQTLSPCGACGGRETVRTMKLTATDQVENLGSTSLSPELDLIDTLYTRVKNHQPADDLASPEALAVIQRSWNDPARHGAEDLFFNDQEKVTRNEGRDQLCFLAYYGVDPSMPAILFTFSGFASALRVVNAQENADPHDRSCTAAK